MPDKQHIKITITGKAATAIDGAGLTYESESLAEGADSDKYQAYLAWNSRTYRNAGRGQAVDMMASIRGASYILDYCEMVGESFSGQREDPDTRADGRALLDSARRIREVLGDRVVDVS